MPTPNTAMKFIIDFDGTLTNVQYEYQYEINRINAELEHCGLPEERTREIMELAMQTIASSPTSYGWTDNGRLTAFSDEDPFMRIIAGMVLIDSWIAEERPELYDLAHALKKAGKTLAELCEDCHQAMNREPLGPFNTPEPEVLQALETLLERDCEIVIVSNSPSKRIISKFEYHGLKPVAHEDNPSARFRVFGRAAKYALADNPRPVEFGSRTVDIARENYAKILREDRPQVVIGDVFSLDLALPLELSRTQSMVYEDMQLYLRTRPYTPQWAVDCILNPPEGCTASARLLNHFADLPSLVLKR